MYISLYVLWQCVCLQSSRKDISTTPFLHMRYEGTDCALMVTPQDTVVSSSECKHGNFGATFTERFASIHTFHFFRIIFLTYVCIFMCILTKVKYIHYWNNELSQENVMHKVKPSILLVCETVPWVHQFLEYMSLKCWFVFRHFFFPSQTLISGIDFH